MVAEPGAAPGPTWTPGSPGTTGAFSRLSLLEQRAQATSNQVTEIVGRLDALQSITDQINNFSSQANQKIKGMEQMVGKVQEIEMGVFQIRGGLEKWLGEAANAKCLAGHAPLCC